MSQPLEPALSAAALSSTAAVASHRDSRPSAAAAAPLGADQPSALHNASRPSAAAAAPLGADQPPALHNASRPSAAAAASHGASRPERRYDVDLIRVLATLAVIVLHTSHLVDKVTPGHTSSGHYIALVADAAGRFAVPAFFALAGWAVLVASPPRNGATVGRRLVRIVVPMAVWTAGYIAFVHLNGWYASTPPKTFAINAIFGQILPAYHLWYLYAYIPLILLLSIAALLRPA